MQRRSLFFLSIFFSVSSLFSLELQWGAAWRQGIRPEMQDAHILDFKLTNGSALFGIFDGHGTCCSKPCKHNAGLMVAEEVVEYVKKRANPFVKQKTVFKNAEKLLKNKSIAKCAGTTALVAQIKDSTLTINWAGDSRILVFDKKGKIKFESKDHTWWNEQEVLRAQSVGAEVLEIEYPNGALVRRVAGLMPARTLGDFRSKEVAPGAIIPDPEEAKVTLRSGDVIIMACDGLWDVFDSKDLIEYYKDLSMIEGRVPVLPDSEDGGAEGALAPLAWQLRDAAYRLDSLDNISVIVITVQ